MKVAGIGYRAGADAESLAAALDLAGGPAGLDALATLVGREGGPLRLLAEQLRLPVIAVCRQDLAGVATWTHSSRIEARFETGSVAEAVALIACGPGASLSVTRKTSPDRMATAAIATAGEDE